MTTAPPRRESIETLKLLADPGRLAILELLSEHEPLAVKALFTRLVGQNGPMGQTNLSASLARLRAGRLVEDERRGQERHYRLTARGTAALGCVAAIEAGEGVVAGS